MEFEGSYFLKEELEDLVPAESRIQLPPQAVRMRSFDEGASIEGETLPEDALRAIQSWLGF